MARGSIRSRKNKDGSTSWMWRVPIAYKPDGNPIQRNGTAATKKEAEDAVRAALTEASSGQAVRSSKQTVKEWLDTWLAGTVAHRVAPSTHASYADVARRLLLPDLGAIPLQKLTPARIVEHYADLLADGSRADGKPGGLSERSVAYAHRVLAMACTAAVHHGVLAKNPCERVSVPRKRGEIAEKPVWTPAQVIAFLGAAAGDTYGAIWTVALHTGLRREELLGLRWADVDLDRAELRIRQVAVLIGTHLSAQGPKSGHGTRAIALNAATVQALREQRVLIKERRLRAGRLWRENDLVFPSEVGTPIGPRNLSRRLQQLSDKAGVPRLGLHGLRRTHATLLQYTTAHPRTVSDRMGHSRVDFTMQHYQMPQADLQRAAAEQFGALLDAARAQGTQETASVPESVPESAP